MNIGKTVVEAVRIAGECAHAQQFGAGIRQRQAAADGFVGVELRAAHGHEQVVPVVAAEEKDADQRVIIGGRLSQGIEAAQAQRAAPGERASGQAQKASS